MLITIFNVILKPVIPVLQRDNRFYQYWLKAL